MSEGKPRKFCVAGMAVVLWPAYDAHSGARKTEVPVIVAASEVHTLQFPIPPPVYERGTVSDPFVAFSPVRTHPSVLNGGPEPESAKVYPTDVAYIRADVFIISAIFAI